MQVVIYIEWYYRFNTFSTEDNMHQAAWKVDGRKKKKAIVSRDILLKITYMYLH